MGDHVLARPQGFLYSCCFIAVRRGYEHGIYGSVLKEWGKAGKDRNAVPTGGGHAETSAPFGNCHQFRRIVAAHPVKHAIDLVVFQSDGSDA